MREHESSLRLCSRLQTSPLKFPYCRACSSGCCCFYSNTKLRNTNTYNEDDDDDDDDNNNNSYSNKITSERQRQPSIFIPDWIGGKMVDLHSASNVHFLSRRNLWNKKHVYTQWNQTSSLFADSTAHQAKRAIFWTQKRVASAATRLNSDKLEHNI